MKKLFLPVFVFISSVANAAPTVSECFDSYPRTNQENTRLFLGCLEKAKQANEASGPKWEPVFPGSSISVNKSSSYYPKELVLSNGETVRDTSFEQIKKLLSGDAARNDRIIDGFSRLWVSYDEFDNEVKFEPSRLMSGNYFAKSHAAIVGSVKNGRVSPRLKIQYYGRDWLFVKSIKVNIDGKVYNLPSAKVVAEHTDKVWEYVAIPLNGEVRLIADRMSTGARVVIRFVGKQYHYDHELIDTNKKDLVKVLAAIDSI